MIYTVYLIYITYTIIFGSTWDENVFFFNPAFVYFDTL